jgi:hypothetical protein
VISLIKKVKIGLAENKNYFIEIDVKNLLTELLLKTHSLPLMKINMNLPQIWWLKFSGLRIKKLKSFFDTIVMWQ